MAKQPTNKVNLVMWTPTMKLESNGGTIDEAVVTVFRGLNSPERRAKVLQELVECDQRMTAFEKEKAGK